MKGLTHEQLAIVLRAVAEVEGWDDRHPSIMTNEAGEWVFDGNRNPRPSSQLWRAVKRLEVNQ